MLVRTKPRDVAAAPPRASTKPQRVKIGTARGDVRGVLAPAPRATKAVVFLGGSGGGLKGPSGVYVDLSQRLQATGVTALRLSYRVPNDLNESTYDVLAAVDALKKQGVKDITLVGWSFGGAVAINAGAKSDVVKRVATVSAQSLGTDAVNQLAHKKLLMLHGEADPVIPLAAAKDIFSRDGGPQKKLITFAGDGHALSGHRAEMFEKLFDFSKRL
jgi:hypothetical protein